MKEYKIVENPPNYGGCEIMLNEYAEDGWQVIGFSQYQICLERERVEENEEQSPEQICG